MGGRPKQTFLQRRYAEANKYMKGCVCVLSRFSHVRLIAVPWTVAHQASHPRASPGKNTGGGCHALLPRILPSQGLNPCLLWLLYCGGFSAAEPRGSPTWRDAQPLITGEMQSRSTMRYHLTPVRMSIIKKSTNKCWRGCGGKGNTPTLLVGMYICTASMQNSMEIP